MYVCATHVFNARASQKRTADPMELELQVVVDCHVGTEN